MPCQRVRLAWTLGVCQLCLVCACSGGLPWPGVRAWAVCVPRLCAFAVDSLGLICPVCSGGKGLCHARNSHAGICKAVGQNWLARAKVWRSIPRGNQIRCVGSHAHVAHRRKQCVAGSFCADACDAHRAAVHSRLLPHLPQGFPLQSKDTYRREKRLCARSPMPSAITRMVMFSSATLSRYGLAFSETFSRADCGRGDGELGASLTKCGRSNEQEIQVRITEKQCLSSMKHFLCTLYRRRCYQNTDGDANSVTYGNQVGDTETEGFGRVDSGKGRGETERGGPRNCFEACAGNQTWCLAAKGQDGPCQLTLKHKQCRASNPCASNSA